MAIAPQPFIWGAGGARMTPEEIAQQRKIAGSLMAQGMDYSPIASPWQGASRMAQALMGGLESGQADAASKQNATESSALIASLLGGGAAPASPMTSPAAIAPPTATAAAPGADAIRSGLIERGLPEPVADGFLMNFRDESGLNPGINEAKPLVPGSRGGFGLAQWTGPRRVALEQFAQQSGRPVDDVNTQLDFLVKELQGPEAGAARSIMAAQTPQDAAVAIARDFLRPAQNNLDRRVAQYGGGAAPAAARPSINPAIVQAITSPYVGPQTKAVATMLFKTQMDAQTKASDPMHRAQLEKLLLETQNLKDSGGVKSSLTPVFGEDAQGNTVLLQPTDRGTVVQPKLPEGVKIRSGVDKIDLGTSYQLRDKRTGQVIGVEPKDLRGAESEKALGKAQGGMKASLPSDISNAEQTISQVDDLIKNPGLSSIVGPLGQFRPSYTMGSEGRDALARYNQLKGKAFLSAYATLRGGGQITEVEGTKAENAMARMDRAQSEEDFKQALIDFRDAVKTGMVKLREKSGVAAPGGKTSAGVSWSVE